MSKKVTLAALVNRHWRVPDAEFLSIVEAVSSRAFGGFLDSDDLAALFKSEIEHGAGDRALVAALRARETGARRRNSEADDGDEWSRASKEILASVKAGRLALEGWKVTKFGDSPTGEREPIPGIFFAGDRELVISPTGTLYDKRDSSRHQYYGVVVKTDAFTKAFPAAKPTHGATTNEKTAILSYAEREHTKTGQAPSYKELRTQFPQVSRLSLREVIKNLPAHLHRKRGEKSLTK